MQYNKKYILELENIIMDELIPMYIVGCRASNRAPSTNYIISKLLDARKSKEDIPALLDSSFGKTE